MKKLDLKGSYVFSAPERPLVENPIFITGVTRSGTTLLGQLIGSLTDIEYELGLLASVQIPVLVDAGLLRCDIGALVLSSSIDETMIEHVLGRKVNLRPTDASRFWSMKSIDDLMHRWTHLETRQDVKREVKERRVRFATKSANLTPFYAFLLEAFPQSQIISITRHGFDVSVSITRKSWLNDHILQGSQMIQPRRRVDDTHLVPWWVPVGLEKEFLSWEDSTRSLFTWRYLVEKGEQQKSKLGSKVDRILDVRFESLVESPQETLSKIQSFLGHQASTLKTEEVIQSIDPTRARRISPDKSLYDQDELDRAEQLMEHLGY